MGLVNMESIIKTITQDAEKRGYDVRIRDIAYALLRVKLQDELIAYTVVFGPPEKDNDVINYESLDSTKCLMRWFEKDLEPKIIEKERPEDTIRELIKSKSKKSDDAEDDTMTFEENRAGIETQIAEILELKKLCSKVDSNGEEIKDVKTLAMLHKTEADLRSKLNDKFGASEKSAEQYIIVQPKFNTICPHTRRECWQQTRDFAMEHWHLIPDPKYKK